MSERIFSFGECRPATTQPLRWSCPECEHPIVSQDRIAHLEAIAEHDERFCPDAIPKVVA